MALCDLKGVGFETLKSIAKDRIPFKAFFNSVDDPSVKKKIQSSQNYSKIFELMPHGTEHTRLLQEAKNKVQSLHSRKIQIIFIDHVDYPTQLLDLKDPPQWLFVEGNANILREPSITAVGSRNVSDQGRWLAQYLGFCLNKFNVATVSGLADGVDQIVHRASLDSGLPTIAVLGTGILLDYPKGSQPLRKQIIEKGGAVITEYLPSDTYSAKNFVRRNRIQAALGRIVMPIEWSVKSGTAHTVKFAYDTHRPISFLRTPAQPNFDWIPVEYRQIGKFYTLPQNHETFISDTIQLVEGHNLQRFLL
jgi:DNA protecting protein DprA